MRFKRVENILLRDPLADADDDDAVGICEISSRVRGAIIENYEQERVEFTH